MRQKPTKKKRGTLIRHAPKKPAGPVKLDLGCGPNPREGFTGVDALPFDGRVAIVHDLRKPWPWADASVDEVSSSHFLEHLTGTERVHFFNELYRVLKPGAKALIVTPHWANACAYGDPTHQWPPLSEWAAFYLDKQWRAVNAPHVGYTCDFEYVVGFSFDERVASWNDERRLAALSHSVNGPRDMHMNLTKR